MTLAAGVEVYRVSRWMGRDNISTTHSIYAHLYMTEYDVAAARVQACLAATGPGVACHRAEAR